MAASRTCGRSRAAAMQGSSGQAAAPFPARRSPETMKAGGCGLATPAGQSRGPSPGLQGTHYGFFDNLKPPVFAGACVFRCIAYRPSLFLWARPTISRREPYPWEAR